MANHNLLDCDIVNHTQIHIYSKYDCILFQFNKHWLLYHVILGVSTSRDICDWRWFISSRTFHNGKYIKKKLDVYGLVCLYKICNFYILE